LASVLVVIFVGIVVGVADMVDTGVVVGGHRRYRCRFLLMALLAALAGCWVLLLGPPW
jgi:uncharacterized protein HemY